MHYIEACYNEVPVYTQGDSNVISSYHIYVRCFFVGKLCEMFVILTSLS